MSEDRSRDKYFFERVKSIMTKGVKIARNILLDEVL